MNAEQRVLIIDSDLKNCKAIKYALTEYGFSAYYTLSVVDGIERLNRHNYGLVILDISLSETDGFQLLRFMRQMKNMPILVLSSQVESISGYLRDWGSVDFDDKRRVLDTLVSQVRATSEQVVIHWKL